MSEPVRTTKGLRAMIETNVAVPMEQEAAASKFFSEVFDLEKNPPKSPLIVGRRHAVTREIELVEIWPEGDQRWLR